MATTSTEQASEIPWRLKRDKEQLFLSNLDIERLEKKEVPSLLNSVIDFLVKNRMTAPNFPVEIQEKLRNHREEYHQDIFHLAESTDPFITNVVIHGPPETPYEKGFFHFELKSPKEYPEHPTQVTVKTKVYHPFMQNAKVMWIYPKKDALELKGGRWDSNLTLRDIAFALWRCFKKYKSFPKIFPLATVPPPPALKVLHTNLEEFETTARQWTAEHAKA